MATTHPQHEPAEKIVRYLHMATANGKRAKVSIGRRTLRSANAIAENVTEIERAIASGVVPPKGATATIESLPCKISNRFRKLGIIGEQLAVPSMSIQDLIDAYMELWGNGVTQSTRTHAIDRLNRFVEFCDKSGVRLSSGITDALLVRYRASLMAGSKPSTVRVTMKRCKHMLKTVHQAGLMATWVGKDVESATSSERVRTVNIAKDWFPALLGVIRDPESMITVALARYAGIRVPSEIEHLRWSDITTSTKTWHVYIQNVKTDKHLPRMRKVPIFGELRKLLDAHHVNRYGFGIDDNPPASDYIVDNDKMRTTEGGLTKYLDHGAWDRWRELWAKREVEGTGFYVGIQTQPILDSEPYRMGDRIPRFFQACRASFINDMLDRSVPIGVLASISGHSIQVLAKHYAQVNAAHENYFDE